MFSKSNFTRPHWVASRVIMVVPDENWRWKPECHCVLDMDTQSGNGLIETSRYIFDFSLVQSISSTFTFTLQSIIRFNYMQRFINWFANGQSNQILCVRIEQVSH